MTHYEGQALPLLDGSVLDRLRAELDDDEGVWSVFVQDFVAHLPARTEKVRLALTTADPVGARNAVLSLKTSSQMVGAENLAALALDLEHSLRAAARDDDPDGALPRLAAAYLVRIRQSADQTAYLLKRLLQQRRAGT
jgi:HPt (histidine-containing phosphotransfer) domain-containing protein